MQIYSFDALTRFVTPLNSLLCPFVDAAARCVCDDRVGVHKVHRISIPNSRPCASPPCRPQAFASFIYCGATQFLIGFALNCYRQALLASRHPDEKTSHPLPARMSADSSTVSKTDDSELDVVGTADSPRPSLHPQTSIASMNLSGKEEKN